MNLAPYRKTIAALVGAVLTWLTATLGDNAVSTQEWIALGVAVATALGVYGTPNEAEAGKPPFADKGLTGLGVVLVVLIVLLALGGGLALHPLWFLLLLLIAVVLVV